MVAFPRAGRLKLPLTRMKSDAAKHLSFTKRKKGLKKKVEELAILCGVEACMICFGPQAGKPSSTPYCWGLPGVSHVIDKYRSLSKADQDKKKLDNISILEQQIQKLTVELKLKVDQNISLKIQRAHCLCHGLLYATPGISDLKRVADTVMNRIREADQRLAYLSKHQMQTFAIGLKQETDADSVISHYLPVSSSHLNHELVLTPSQTSTAHHLQRPLTHLNSYGNEAAENLPMLLLMNGNAQPYQQTRLTQFPEGCLPDTVGGQSAGMETNDSISTNANFCAWLNPNPPTTSADGSDVRMNPSLHL